MSEVMPLPETALVTLWCRASEARRPDGILHDPMAISLIDAINYDFSKFRLSTNRQDVALRSLAFDEGTRHYLARHPKATVVALGEGLQTSFWRLDAASPNREFRWMTVELPPMLALRRQLLPDSPRVSACGQSALDFSWMDRIDPSDGVFVTAEGLLPYFQPDQARNIIGECARRFPGGQMMFDLPPKSHAALARSALWTKLRGDWPRTPFSLTVRELAGLGKAVPGIRSVRNLPLPRGRGPLFGVLLRRTQRGPLQVPLRWLVGHVWPTIATLTVLEFDP